MYVSVVKDTDIKLKNCPFCGCKAYLYKEIDFDSYKVECSLCGIRTCGYSTAQIAVETWNRRDERKKKERKVKKC